MPDRVHLGVQFVGNRLQLGESTREVVGLFWALDVAHPPGSWALDHRSREALLVSRAGIASRAGDAFAL